MENFKTFVEAKGYKHIIIVYQTHDGETLFFQTQRGLSILKAILDDYNKTHFNRTNAYADIRSDTENEAEIIKHPFYRKFIYEAQIAHDILISAMFESGFMTPLVPWVSANNILTPEDNATSNIIFGPSIHLENELPDDYMEQLKHAFSLKDVLLTTNFDRSLVMSIVRD